MSVIGNDTARMNFCVGVSCDNPRILTAVQLSLTQPQIPLCYAASKLSLVK